MTDDERPRSDPMSDDLARLDLDADADAFLVIRAWHETDGGKSSDEHWRGQISHGQTTSKFVGISMLFDRISTLLAGLAPPTRPEDRE
ncbi:MULTISPECIES: hypothetical protein [unclassified Mameliella]|uniref:hypothetical protein n=1 Tax=unclassified Mameliella TaxID=2630630 RepID=UPI00273EF595|nr:MULTISPECIES: hypothetical protein [unclassified Mameliella]